MIETNNTNLNKAINSSFLTKKSKAFLLLTLCELSKIFSDILYEKYLKELEKVKSDLPQQYLKEYNSLLPTKPAHKVEEKGFIAGIIKEIRAAIGKYPSDNEAAKAELEIIGQKLKKAWWRSNKYKAWLVIAEFWLNIDREKSIILLKNIPSSKRMDPIKIIYQSKPFTNKEWDTLYALHNYDLNLISLAEYYFNNDENLSYIPGDLALQMAKKIISEITGYKTEINENKTNSNIEKYFQLVRVLTKSNTEFAETLLSRLYKSFVNDKNSFDLSFTYSFQKVQSIVNEWLKISPDKEKSLEILEKESTVFIKDFALAQWFGSLSIHTDAVAENYEKLVSKVTLQEEAERWFFILLVGNGLYTKAAELVNKSKFKNVLIPELDKTFIYHYPEEARKTLSLPGKEADPVGYFILLPSNNSRIEFLKNNQSGIFREVLWKKPDYHDFIAKDPRCLYTYYSRKVEPMKMFNEFLITTGFRKYDHYNFDSYLLSTLKTWSETDKAGASAFVSEMWQHIKPEDSDLRLDLFRNSIFERCRNVFGAHPETLFNFLNWIKSKMVDNVYSYQEGQTVYSLQLKIQTIYYYALIAAETVGKISAKLCDEILVKATKQYAKNTEEEKEFIIIAARLYALDRGVKALDEEMDYIKGVLEIWQQAIIDSSRKNILQELILSVENPFQEVSQTEESISNYQKFEKSGVCDVCNKSIEPNEAFLVPVEAFYSSSKYEDWLKNGPLSVIIQSSGGIAEYLKVTRETDKSEYSAVCPDCIYMFS